MLQTNFLDFRESCQSCSVLVIDIENVDSQDLMVLFSQDAFGSTSGFEGLLVDLQQDLEVQYGKRWSLEPNSEFSQLTTNEQLERKSKEVEAEGTNLVEPKEAGKKAETGTTLKTIVTPSLISSLGKIDENPLIPAASSERKLLKEEAEQKLAIEHRFQDLARQHEELTVSKKESEEVNKEERRRTEKFT